MWYAFPDGVSTNWREGSIEITWEQYVEAVNGMMNGLMVSVESGFEMIEPPPPETIEENVGD